MKNNIRVALYARKSSESEDRQVLSIDSQIKELRDYAKRQSLMVSQVFTESKSAKAPGRPVFNELYQRVQKGEFGVIICWKLDRLARNPIDGGALIWALDQNQLQKIVTPTNTFSNAGNDKFWMQLEFGMAKKYVDDLSDNVKRGLRAKLEQGWLPRPAPIGYLNEKTNRTIVKDPVRFPIVRRVFETLLTGTKSLAQVHRLAVGWGLSTQFRDGSESGPLSFSSFQKLIKSPFYYGAIQFGGRLYKGAHQPVVSKTEFDRVQELINGRSWSRPHRNQFAYAGLITCGECRATITAEQKVNRYGYRYVYYRCSHRKAGPVCRQRAIEEAYLEHQLLSFFGTITMPQEHLGWVQAILKGLDEESSLESTRRLGRLKRALELRKKELSALLTMRLRGLIDDEQYQERESFLQSDRIDIERRIAQSAQNTKDASNAVLQVFERAVNVSTLFKKSDIDGRRSLIASVCSDLFLRDKILSIHAQKPFGMIQNFLCLPGSENGMFGPQLEGEHQRKISGVNDDFSEWRGLVSDVRTFFIEHPDSFWLK